MFGAKKEREVPKGAATSQAAKRSGAGTSNGDRKNGDPVSNLLSFLTHVAVYEGLLKRAVPQLLRRFRVSPKSSLSLPPLLCPCL